MTPLMLAAALLAAEPSKKTELKFDEPDLIEGGLKGPADTYVTFRKRPDFKTMIKVRENFDDKIVRSVDQM